MVMFCMQSLKYQLVQVQVGYKSIVICCLLLNKCTHGQMSHWVECIESERLF